MNRRGRWFGAIFALLLVISLVPLRTVASSGADQPAEGPPFLLGAVEDTPEQLRAAPYHVPLKRPDNGFAPHDDLAASGLPAAVDHSAGLPPVRSQGSLNSCTAWSIGYYYQGFQEWREHGWGLDDPRHQFSPSFVYNQINGGSDGGSSPSSALNLLAAEGSASWDAFPSTTDYRLQPDANQHQAALPFTIAGWSWFQKGDAAGIKSHLAGGDLVSLMIPVYANFYSPASPCDTPIDVPSAGTPYYGLHQITLVGYDDAIGAFKFVNSWGAGWGCDGFGWLTYAFVSGYGRYGYTMSARRDELGVMSGYVVDSAGQGIADAEVAAAGYAIRTDASGAFALAIPAGEQVVAVNAGGYEPWTGSITLTAGEVSALDVTLHTGGTEVPPSAARVIGTVTRAADGAAIAGAVIDAGNNTTTSGPDGGYVLDDVPPGDVTVTISALGFVPASHSISVAAGDEAVLDARLEQSRGAVMGVVTSANGAPVAGAGVSLGSATTTTGADGSYRFDDLPPWTYPLNVTAPGFLPHSSQVTVGPGETVSINPVLNPEQQPQSGRFNALVLDAANGKPLGGAIVSIGGLTGKTNKSGRFTGELPSGTYTLTAGKSRYASATRQVVVLSGETTEVVIRLSR